jgi:hypothetical protein
MTTGMKIVIGIIVFAGIYLPLAKMFDDWICKVIDKNLSKKRDCS